MVGNKVRLYRRKKGLLQKALAELIEVSPSLICKIEKNKAYPSLITLTKIAKVLGVDIANLLN
jgi:transcriptional regulator with XRE-family HTH domain